MTVPEFNPRFTNEDDWACCSVDDNSPWCLAISDCIWDYMGRFYDIDCEVKTCEWPLTEFQFNFRKGRLETKGCNNYEEYLSKHSEVIYSTYTDNEFYGLKNTDGTCDFAYQNPEYVFIIHIDCKEYKSKRHLDSYWEGFGCVVSKKDPKDIHFVALGEDDGNYWGDHDLTYDKLDEYDYGIVSEVINEMNPSEFENKDKIVEKIFELSRTRKLYGTLWKI